MYYLIKNDEASLVVSDQRRVFHDDYMNYHLLHINCFVEVSKQNLLSHKKTLDVEELKKETCILVASKDQQDVEREFYENIIGLKCHYLFSEDIEEAKLLVSMNRGFMPLEHVSLEDTHDYTKTIPLYKNNRQLQRNYCAFWKKERNHYYIEEFVKILENKMKNTK